MNIRRKISAIAAVLGIALLAAAPAGAVTKDEMDRARAVTAQWYLRWVNNGSDYLDNLNPKSMADLEGQLKEKEKENIKAFKNAGMPSDYASWDKDKVVEYWSATFFQAKGLDEKGKGARARVKKKLLALNFTDPADMPKETPAEAAPELPATGAPADTAKKAEEAPSMPSAEQVIDQTNAAESAIAADTIDDSASVSKKESGSGTWLYVVALIVLIGVVVWLVIFASKTMQNSSKAAKDLEDDDDEPTAEESRRSRRNRRPEVRKEEVEETTASTSAYRSGSYSGSDEEILREKFARKLAAKDEEIHDLRREINDLRNENLRLSEDRDRLASDLKMARRELESDSTRIAPAPAAAAGAAEESRPARRNPAAREIYLGRVNSKGLFVRADRKPVEGKSVFVLTTTDSYTGTFRVLQAGATVDMALDNPDYYLAGGCVAPDINDTAEADGIRTISSGTAVFEDGCWKVLRKAKIVYE